MNLVNVADVAGGDLSCCLRRGREEAGLQTSTAAPGAHVVSCHALCRASARMSEQVSAVRLSHRLVRAQPPYLLEAISLVKPICCVKGADRVMPHT